MTWDDRGFGRSAGGPLALIGRQSPYVGGRRLNARASQWAVCHWVAVNAAVPAS